jgi:ribulose-5-phosphate 4-epimerase/fuculose-1-phosphate aldolase
MTSVLSDTRPDWNSLPAIDPTVRDRVSEEEWATRVDLAACYRLVARFGWTDMIYNHISARVPGTHDRFLINAFGLTYEEVSASNLVTVDTAGKVLDGPASGANPAGFLIHSAIHQARPDAACVIHTHSKAGTAVCAQAGGLRNISQHAMRFHNRLGYHEYGGIVLETAMQTKLVEDLGDKRALVLRNHGLLTVGADIRSAFEDLYYLELACQIQVAAQAGGELIECSEEIAEFTAQQFDKSNDGFIHGRDWAALRRILDRVDPSYAQ